MRRAEGAAGAERAALAEELEEARERLGAERAAQRLAAERVEATTREVELLRADLAAQRQNLAKAEADKARVRRCFRGHCPAALPAPCLATQSGAASLPMSTSLLRLFQTGLAWKPPINPCSPAQRAGAGTAMLL